LDVLDRWRQPEQWRKPGRIALANMRAVRPDDPMLAALSDAGAELVPAPLRDQDGRVSREVAEADVVVSGGARLDREFFAELQTTRLLLRPYVGYDDIDVDGATEQGVLVANVPDAITEDVANQTMALIIAANREVLRLDRYVRDGSWHRNKVRTPEGMKLYRPTVQTLGLVGFGNIAQAVAKRARPFGYRIVAHDPFIPPEVAAQQDVALLPLDDLLREADVVSIHVFLSPQTRHMIDADKLALMKPTAWIVNTARGPVIDEEALIAALHNGTIAGAGLDVMEVEPLDPQSPLITMENVILAPHVAGYSEQGVSQLRSRAAEIALQVALGGLPQRHVVINKGLYDQLAALPELASVPRP
jgi:D-3-phosphoglycerate dehydrogenase